MFAEQTRYPVVGCQGGCGRISMRSFFVGISAIYLVVASAFAQTPSTSSPALSLDQQNKISEIVTNRTPQPVSYTHLRAHETGRNLVCRLLLEKKKKNKKT